MLKNSNVTFCTILSKVITNYIRQITNNPTNRLHAELHLQKSLNKAKYLKTCDFDCACFTETLNYISESRSRSNILEKYTD